MADMHHLSISSSCYRKKIGPRFYVYLHVLFAEGDLWLLLALVISSFVCMCVCGLVFQVFGTFV